MPRPARRWQWTDAACYHLLNRGHNRQTVFADDHDRLHFLHLLARYRDRFRLRIYHYCLMGNPFHLLLQLDDARRLSALVAGLLRSYVHYFHRKTGFVGHLWQGRFRGPAIETDSYLLSCGRYIERNPLAVGLAAEPWSYRWSSCRAYALGEPDGLLAENPWYRGLSPDPEQRRQLWRRFVQGEDPQEVVVQRADWLVGGEEFRRRVYQQAGRPAPRPRGRPRKHEDRMEK